MSEDAVDGRMVKDAFNSLLWHDKKDRIQHNLEFIGPLREGLGPRDPPFGYATDDIQICQFITVNQGCARLMSRESNLTRL